MKKAVITILGIQNPNYDENGDAHIKDYNHQATYYFENNPMEAKQYFNTLPLLINLYSKDYDIVPFYTEDAKNYNKEVLSHANLTCMFNDKNSLIEDEKIYINIFSKIDTLLNKYDEVIIDLTHGFRHLPILAVIDLVIQNFKSNKKIKNIYFAKEIIKHTPIEAGEYEIVDLKEYLDIASISYVLSSFENNYTISNNIKTINKDYQELINMLSKFSEHIMANSLINLFRGKDSLIERIINVINSVITHKDSKPLRQNLILIKEHLQDFITLKSLNTYQQLFELSKIMNKKGYYLNSITLLNEAVSWYCAENLCDYSKSFKKKYDQLKERNSYKLVSNSKNIIKFSFNGREYKNDLKIDDIKDIQQLLRNIEGCEKFVKDLIEEVDKNRNNLAHANSDKQLSDIRKLFEKLFGRFNTYCLNKNILKKYKPTIKTLANKFNG